MRRFKRVTAGCLSVLVMIQATGCMSWNTVTLPVAVAKDRDAKVRVVLQGGGSITADSLQARADSVVTYQGGGVGAVALAQVKEFKLHQSSIGKTVALIFGLGVAVYLALGIMVRAAD